MKRNFNQRTGLKATATVVYVLLFLLSCKKEVLHPAASVNVQIQNATPSQPIALRLTDECWTVINPGNTYTYSGVAPLDSTILIAFTDDESPEAFARIQVTAITWDNNPCNEEYVAPPYNAVKNFSFTTIVTQSDEERNYTPTIHIIAEKIPGLIASKSWSSDNLSPVKSGSVDSGTEDEDGINKVSFRVVQ